MSLFLAFENGGGFEFDFCDGGDLCYCDRYDFPSDADFSQLPGVVETEEGVDNFVGLEVERRTRRKTYFRILFEEDSSETDASCSHGSSEADEEAEDDLESEEEETCSEESESG